MTEERSQGVGGEGSGKCVLWGDRDSQVPDSKDQAAQGKRGGRSKQGFCSRPPRLSTSLASFSKALRVTGGTHSFPSLHASHTRARTHTHPLPFLARPLVPVNLDYYLESEGWAPPKPKTSGPRSPSSVSQVRLNLRLGEEERQEKG